MVGGVYMVFNSLKKMKVEFEINSRHDAIAARNKLDEIVDSYEYDKYTKSLLEQYSDSELVDKNKFLQDMLLRTCVFEYITNVYKTSLHLSLRDHRNELIDVPPRNSKAAHEIKKRLEANRNICRENVKASEKSCTSMKILKMQSVDGEVIENVTSIWFELYAQLGNAINIASSQVKEEGDIRAAVLLKHENGNIFVGGGKYKIILDE